MSPAAASGTKLSPDMQRSWDRREKLAKQHQGTIVSETPDEIVVKFPHFTRASAFFDEMATRGFVVEQASPGAPVRVRRREAPHDTR